MDHEAEHVHEFAPLRGQVIGEERSHRRIEGQEALVEPRGDRVGLRAELRETLLDIGDVLGSSCPPSASACVSAMAPEPIGDGRHGGVRRVARPPMHSAEGAVRQPPCSRRPHDLAHHTFRSPSPKATMSQDVVTRADPGCCTS